MTDKPKRRFRFSLRTLLIVVVLAGIATGLLRPHRSEIEFVACGIFVEADELGQPEFVAFRVRIVNNGPDAVWWKGVGTYGVATQTNGEWTYYGCSTLGSPLEKVAKGESVVIIPRLVASTVLDSDSEGVGAIRVGVNTYQRFGRRKTVIWSDPMQVPFEELRQALPNCEIHWRPPHNKPEINRHPNTP